MPDQPRSSGAVFISYAREDGEAARRIAEALRAFGVEVWFDQNELRGGDAWDRHIRRQIKECTLFIPLISAHSQAREEGYFRREWRLAVERTHDMAENRAFIVPVLVDDTREADANVPEQFLKAHCTRLPAGEPTPQFVAQVKRLLSAPAAKSGAARASTGTATARREVRRFRPDHRARCGRARASRFRFPAAGGQARARPGARCPTRGSGRKPRSRWPPRPSRPTRNPSRCCPSST